MIDVQSIGIALVLENGVAEGLRQVSRDMAVFGRHTDDTAARMGRLAQRTLAPVVMREAARKPVLAPVPESPVTAIAPRVIPALSPAPVLRAPPRPVAPRADLPSSQPRVSSPTPPTARTAAAPVPPPAAVIPQRPTPLASAVVLPARALAPQAAAPAVTPTVTPIPVAPPPRVATPMAPPPRISIALSAAPAPAAAPAAALPLQLPPLRTAAPRMAPAETPTPPPRPSASDPIVMTAFAAPRAPRALAASTFAPTSKVQIPDEATRAPSFDQTSRAVSSPPKIEPTSETPVTTMQGDVLLDGTKVGRWMSGMMTREATRPPTAARGFNMRMTPAWPGTPL